MIILTDQDGAPRYFWDGAECSAEEYGQVI